MSLGNLWVLSISRAYRAKLKSSVRWFPANAFARNTEEFQSLRGNVYIVSPGKLPQITNTMDAHLIFKGFDPSSSEILSLLRTVGARFAPSNIWLLATTIPLQERLDWAAKGRGLIIGTETAFDEAVQEAQAVRPLASGTNTVFMDFRLICGHES